MARGEGAAADARASRGGVGPRHLVLGLVLVAVLAAFVYWVVLRGETTWARATAVTVDVPAEQVVVEFAPPDGCWHVTDDSSVAALFGGLELDLRLESADDGCATSHDFPLPLDAADLPAEVTVSQVACDTRAISCRGESLRAAVVRDG